jgi:hypothetical protein
MKRLPPTIPAPTIPRSQLPPSYLPPVIDVLDGYNEIIESEHYLLLVRRAEEINLINKLNTLMRVGELLRGRRRV